MAAVQGFRQFKREEFFANALVAGEKQRAGNSAAGQQTPQRFFYFIVADKFGKHKMVSGAVAGRWGRRSLFLIKRRR